MEATQAQVVCYTLVAEVSCEYQSKGVLWSFAEVRSASSPFLGKRGGGFAEVMCVSQAQVACYTSVAEVMCVAKFFGNILAAIS